MQSPYIYIYIYIYNIYNIYICNIYVIYTSIVGCPDDLTKYMTGRLHGARPMTVESIHPDAPLAIHSVGSLVFDQQKPRGKRGFFGSQMAKI